MFPYKQEERKNPLFKPKYLKKDNRFNTVFIHMGYYKNKNSVNEQPVKSLLENFQVVSTSKAQSPFS